jgi:hypothetical protein
MKRRLTILTLSFVLCLALASPTGAAPGYCFAECNYEGANYCRDTGNCYSKCSDIQGGCISWFSSGCFDYCRF